jgi:hypothetical protein
MENVRKIYFELINWYKFFIWLKFFTLLKSLLILLKFRTHVLPLFNTLIFVYHWLWLQYIIWNAMRIHFIDWIFMTPKCCLMLKNAYVPVLRTLGSKLDPKVRHALWGRTPKYVTHFRVGPQSAFDPKVRCYILRCYKAIYKVAARSV